MSLLEHFPIRGLADSLLVKESQTTLKIIPDRTVRPWNVEAFARSLWELYLPPIKRVESWRPLKYRMQESFTFAIKLAETINFYLTIPERWSGYVKGKLALCYPRATISQEKNTTGIRTYKNVASNTKLIETSCEVSLLRHDFWALNVAGRDYKPLGAVLENVRDLTEGESIIIETTATPIEREDWTRNCQETYKMVRRGEKLEKVSLDGEGILEKVGEMIDGAFSEAAGFLDFMMGTEKQKEIQLPGYRRISPSTIQKMSSPPFLTRILVTAYSLDPLKAKVLTKSVANALNELAGDNEFIAREPSLLPRKSVLSAAELSKLLLLPGAELQVEYPQIESIQHRQSRLPATVTTEGLLIGHSKRQGVEYPVYLPTRNLDELCLPHVVIGGMGTGKTKGFGANLVVEAVKKGYGAIVIDPEKGEIGDEVGTMVPITRIRFGHDVISLDWREALHSPRSRNRLANEIVSFVDAQSDEAGAQTVRYLRSAAKIAPTGSLNEIVQTLTDIDYLKSLDIPESERTTWNQFMLLSEARRNQIALPVLNRLDIIQGDDYLSECMESKRGLDFVRLLDIPKAIIIDIPKGLLGREAADILGSLIATKIDLAMTLRDSSFPVFVVIDEPHQILRGTRIWRSAAVESRKWRFGYTWMFHAWEQIPRELAAIIQAAGPHYHLYRTSKATYQSLAEEIRPFDIEEAMETPLYHAINVIRAGGGTVTPFLAKMLKPPSMRKS